MHQDLPALVHGLKCTIFNFGGRPATEMFLCLEMMRKTGGLSGTGEAFDRLKHGIERFGDVLTKFVGGTSCGDFTG
jgi:hypothetical protein